MEDVVWGVVEMGAVEGIWVEIGRKDGGLRNFVIWHLPLMICNLRQILLG